MHGRDTVLRSVLHAIAALAAVAAATALLGALAAGSPTTVALTYLLVVLSVASWTNVAVALATAAAAMLSLNFFFLPPVGSFSISDPQNWVALFAFIVVAVVASHLSSTARARTTEAIERRKEVARLFDVSRDVLLTTDGEGTATAVARHVSRRFELAIVTIAIPREGGGWEVVQGGSEAPAISETEFDRAWAAARGALEFDARTRSYGGHRTLELPSGPAALIPVRAGLRAMALVALGGRTLDAGTADAIAGLVAIAIERARFLEERRASDLAHHRADLTSALLAALGHDLRTPLTTIRVAVANAADPNLAPGLRVEQSHLALTHIDHLARLLQEILDLSRIEAHAVEAERAWATAGEIVEAAVAHAGAALSRHRLVVDADGSVELQLDPRLTSAALAHVLENAARYSPEGSAIAVKATASSDALCITVADEGPGLQNEDLDALFDPFVRGRLGRRRPTGTGLGLAITKGLLAAEGGRIWAEPGGPGARFTMLVPAPTRAVAPQEASS